MAQWPAPPPPVPHIPSPGLSIPLPGLHSPPEVSHPPGAPHPLGPAGAPVSPAVPGIPLGLSIPPGLGPRSPPRRTSAPAVEEPPRRRRGTPGPGRALVPPSRPLPTGFPSAPCPSQRGVVRADKASQVLQSVFVCLFSPIPVQRQDTCEGCAGAEENSLRLSCPRQSIQSPRGV